jgi:delta 1-pyrroline-5-carboxylate dehydrogenase
MATSMSPAWRAIQPPTLLGSLTTLPGPTGERNTLALVARGAIACAAARWAAC